MALPRWNREREGGQGRLEVRRKTFGGRRGVLSVETLRVAAVQMEHQDTLAESLERARGLLAQSRGMGARVALLPEYFFAGPGRPPETLARDAREVRGFLLDASRELGLAVAGNAVEPAGGGIANVGLVAEAGRFVLEQPKVHPMPREAAGGVVAGARFDAAPVLGLPTGMLVCADILYPEAARVLALQGARVLLNPVMSPWRPGAEDPTRAARESVFVARAYDNGAFVVKAGGYRRPTPEGARGVAGRSLVTAPWGTLARAGDDFTEEVLVAELDLAALERFRQAQEAFPPRRPDAYRDLLGL